MALLALVTEGLDGEKKRACSVGCYPKKATFPMVSAGPSIGMIMPVNELIQQFHASSRLMKKAIATDDSDAIERLDNALAANFESIMGFRVRNEVERQAVGRFLAGYLEDMCDGSVLSTRATARMIELIGVSPMSNGGGNAEPVR